MRPDDPNIDNDTPLLRVLVGEGWWKIDGEAKRATSFAFMDQITYETSCYLDTPSRRQIIAHRYPGLPVARFTAGDARRAGFNLTRDPEGDIPDKSPEHHVLTHPESNDRKKYQKSARPLAKASQFIPPEQLFPAVGNL